MKQLKPNSKYLLYGQALSFMGDYCVLPALLILSTYYHDYWVTSGVIVVRSIPMVFQPFLGVLVDRLDRIKIMLWTDIIRGIIFLGLTFLPKGEYPLIFLALLFISYGSGVFLIPPVSLSCRPWNQILKASTRYLQKRQPSPLSSGRLPEGSFC